MQNLNEVLNKEPQPIETEADYNTALWDRLILEEAPAELLRRLAPTDEFDTDYINRSVYIQLVEYITNWESK